MSGNSKLKTENLKLQTIVSSQLAWFAANARDLPWRRTRDPYAIWVSEIMLQQTQVQTVIPYWERWLRELPDLAALAAAPPAKIHKLWEGLGYYTRVRNMQKAAQQIVATHDGQFPRDFAAVLALPGIGRYTAGAICSIAYNQPAPILDGNVIRVLTRIFGIAGDPREKSTNAHLWQLAGELVLHSKLKTKNSKLCCSHFNQSLMELGALLCTPRNPQCDRCPVQNLCIARRENRIVELPNLPKRAAATERHFIAFVVARGGKFLVRQRPAGVVNAHLWEFPNVEALGAPASRRRVPKPNSKPPASGTPALPACDFTPTTNEPLCTIRHAITRYRITLEAYRATLSEGRVPRVPNIPNQQSGTRGTRPSEVPGVWLPLPQLDQLAFTAAHRKILARLRA